MELWKVTMFAPHHDSTPPLRVLDTYTLDRFQVPSVAFGLGGPKAALCYVK
jgi:hypothetical protein